MRRCCAKVQVLTALGEEIGQLPRIHLVVQPPSVVSLEILRARLPLDRGENVALPHFKKRETLPRGGKEKETHVKSSLVDGHVCEPMRGQALH